MASQRRSNSAFAPRVVARVGRVLRRGAMPQTPAPAQFEERLDSWLEHFYRDTLADIDARCATRTSPETHALFRDLDDDLWAVLLSQEYELYPHIRQFLPSMPEPALQELWNGASGIPLAVQSKAFYTKLKTSYARYGRRPLTASRVVDFGCGWGRLTRFLTRDVPPGQLYGCDPVAPILDMCRANSVDAQFAQSAFVPDGLPFSECFDLAYAFSVFTHLSEQSHERSLRALHRSLQPGGILILTIRPPAYLAQSEHMRQLSEEVRLDGQALAGPRYLFAPHPSNPWQSPGTGGEQADYGETVITMPYVREHWSSLFRLLATDLLLTDPYQVVLTLRRE